MATAANLLGAKPYDMVFLDMDMPVKSGSDLAADLHGVPGGDRQDQDGCGGVERIERHPEPAHEAHRPDDGEQCCEQRQEDRLGRAKGVVVHESDHEKREREVQRHATGLVADRRGEHDRARQRPVEVAVVVCTQDLLDRAVQVAVGGKGGGEFEGRVDRQCASVVRDERATQVGIRSHPVAHRGRLRSRAGSVLHDR